MLITGVKLQNQSYLEIPQPVIPNSFKNTLVPKQLNLYKNKKIKLQKINSENVNVELPQSQKNKQQNIFQDNNVLPLIANKQINDPESKDLGKKSVKKSLTTFNNRSKVISQNKMVEKEALTPAIQPANQSKSLEKKFITQRSVKTTGAQQLKNKNEQIQNVQIEDFDLDKLTFSFRYHIITLFQQQSNIDPVVKDQKKEVLYRLIKIINTKTKYRYRCKMHVINHAPLKQFFNIDAKARYEKLQAEKKQKYEQISSSSESDDDDQYVSERKKKAQEPISFAMLDSDYWKKKNGLSKKTKIFICKGGYSGIRNALLDRGWFENDNYNSPVFDLKWTCKQMDCYQTELKSHQLINHFRNTDVYATKSGLSRNLRNLIQHGVDIDKFFPKCYDLFDQLDFLDFIEEFKFSFGISNLIKYIDKNYDQTLDLLNEVKLKVAMTVTKRRLQKVENLLNVTEQNYLINKQEWDLLYYNQNKLQDYDLNEINLTLNQNLEITENLWPLAKSILTQLKQVDPQFCLYGEQNIWIVKPALLSRGRGIKVYKSLNKIIDHLLYKDNQYIAQKYIERPLLIKQRKFDIRQWAIITNWNPLKIWFYDLCYIRFSGTKYDPLDLENRFVHLTNNAIQQNDKNFAKSEIPGNMWTSQQFQDYLKNINDGKDIFKENIQPAMEKQIIYSLKSCNDQVEEISNSFEIYDFMVDEEYNTWILEINKSPSMDSKTTVAKNMIADGLEDTIKVVIDYERSKKRNKKEIDTGHFRCIYKSNK